MTTKKDAASEAVLIARMIHREAAGDDEADVWIQLLLGLARSLDPQISDRSRLGDVYVELLTSDRESTRTKLRRLIDHPGTPQPERDAALAALARLRRSDD